MSPKDIPSEVAKSPVFQRGAPMHPGLVRPTSYWGLGLGMLGVGLIGLITFLTLSGNRSPAVTTPQIAQVAPVAPPPVAAPAPPPPPPQAPTEPTPLPQPQAAAPEPPASWRAPAMIVDLSQSNGIVAPAPGTAPATAPVAGAGTGDNKLTADETFAARITTSDVDTAQATKLANLSQVAPQGTVIPAVLETAINSDLPGFVRAVVSRDVRGFDGTTVLVPRGSKLIGQYRSGVAQSQTRAFVVWSRILTPQGVSVDVGSPATDRLGRGGLDGETNTHFFERFGGAILLSVVSAGLDALSSNNNNTSIVIGSAQQASQVAGIALQNQINIPPTITVPQGTPLQVFVTRDLDFSGVMTAKK